MTKRSSLSRCGTSAAETISSKPAAERSEPVRISCALDRAPIRAVTVAIASAIDSDPRRDWVTIDCVIARVFFIRWASSWFSSFSSFSWLARSRICSCARS
ncbi:hypothetical protein D3C72_2203130 [compost metagenome]